MKMDKCNISKTEVVLGAPDRVNILYFMHDTRLWGQINSYRHLEASINLKNKYVIHYKILGNILIINYPQMWDSVCHHEFYEDSFYQTNVFINMFIRRG